MGVIGRAAEHWRHRRAWSTPRSSFAKHGIPDAHLPESIAEATRLGAVVHERDLRGRTDFRGAKPTVTIDGEHARDFDDAITIERLENGNYWLASTSRDVAHHAGGECALDNEACARGTSVYFQSARFTCSHGASTGCAASIRTSTGSCSRA